MSAQSYAIIGAGPAGLAASRALAQLDIPHVIYEKHSDVGGIWDIDNPGSPIYESAHFISSRFTAGFGGFPMPEEYPDYPNHRQVLAYIRDFAKAYDLRRNIVFNHEVFRAEPEPNGWILYFKNGKTVRHQGVICANGVTWLPNLPVWPGRFSGEIRHSSSYRSAHEFEGKNVLIVGLGNSGADIACDAARNARHAAISVRRGYHFLPKHLHGWPIDLFFRRPDLLPPELRTIDVVSAVSAITGNPARFGMPEPDHQLGQSHPILNSQLLHYLGHGDIDIRPDIARLEDNRVVFTDGSTMEVDLILAATGYQVRAPYMDDALFELQGQRVMQYMNVFHRQRNDLFTLGFAEVAAGIYPLFDEMAHVLAHHLSDKMRRPTSASAFDVWKEQDGFDPRGALNMIASDRHANYVDLNAYRQHTAALCARFGWPVFDPKLFAHHASELSGG